ncbi:ribosomal-protein-alanine N-acetyltransferase [Flavobacteriaceae bacterium UJ101]|nr:ribosomal-protein-alanine N-acetyltransferase [Flavobacteriaceae bacterium UJ101]
MSNQYNFSTERLSICQLEKDHFPLFQQELVQSAQNILTPTVLKSLPDTWHTIHTKEQIINWFKEQLQESIFLIIRLHTNQQIIGYLFLMESIASKDQYTLQLGYLFSQQYWGKGLGTELIKGLVKCCEKKGTIQSISGGVVKDNIGSIKVLEKNGFHIIEGKLSSDSMIFLKREFDL